MDLKPPDCIRQDLSLTGARLQRPTPPVPAGTRTCPEHTTAPTPASTAGKGLLRCPRGRAPVPLQGVSCPSVSPFLCTGTSCLSPTHGDRRDQALTREHSHDRKSQGGSGSAGAEGSRAHWAGCGMRALFQGQALSTGHAPVPSPGRELRREPCSALLTPVHSPGHGASPHEHSAPVGMSSLVWKEKPRRQEKSCLSFPDLHTQGVEPRPGHPTANCLGSATCWTDQEVHLIGTFQKNWGA